MFINEQGRKVHLIIPSGCSKNHSVWFENLRSFASFVEPFFKLTNRLFAYKLLLHEGFTFVLVFNSHTYKKYSIFYYFYYIIRSFYSLISLMITSFDVLLIPWYAVLPNTRNIMFFNVKVKYTYVSYDVYLLH